MTVMEIGAYGVVALFVLVALYIPLAFAMIAVGIIAFALQTSWQPALTFLATEPSQVLGSMDLTSVPLFLMMGAFVNVSGFSKDLYAAAAALLGHRRGGMSYATIGGSAAFGAICGSSPATTDSTTSTTCLRRTCIAKAPPSTGAPSCASWSTGSATAPRW